MRLTSGPNPSPVSRQRTSQTAALLTPKPFIDQSFVCSSHPAADESTDRKEDGSGGQVSHLDKRQDELPSPSSQTSGHMVPALCRYFQYKQLWDMFKLPGEKDHRAVRLEIKV